MTLQRFLDLYKEHSSHIDQINAGFTPYKRPSTADQLATSILQGAQEAAEKLKADPDYAAILPNEHLENLLKDPVTLFEHKELSAATIKLLLAELVLVKQRLEVLETILANREPKKLPENNHAKQSEGEARQ